MVEVTEDLVNSIIEGKKKKHSKEELEEMLKSKEDFLKIIHDNKQKEVIRRKQKFYFFEENNKEIEKHAENCNGLTEQLLDLKNSVKNEKKQRRVIVDYFKNITYNEINLFEKTEQNYRLSLKENRFYLMDKDNKQAKVDFMCPIQKKKLVLFYVGNLIHLVDFKADKQLSIHIVL